MSRLSKGELLQLATGALLFSISFIPLWGSYSSVSASGRLLGHGDLDGWGSYGFAANLALLLTLSLLLLIATRAAGIDIDIPRRGVTYAALSLATCLLLVAAVVGGPVVDVPGRGREHGVTRGPLAYLSLVLAALMFHGSRLHGAVGVRSHRGSTKV